jgi:3-hydroxy-9,10-secoandrosta-1,3,5(10)-triene-9,17-dione monooxygenase
MESTAMLDKTRFGDERVEGLVAAAKDMRPYLLEMAPKHEASRRLDAEVVSKLLAADMFKVAVPRRWGGLCLSADGMAQVAVELAKGCPSTAWIYCISNSASWVASLATDAVQEDVFAGGVPIMCSAVNPPGTFVKVEGGYRINGAFPYSSGCYDSKWGMFALASKNAEGRFVPAGQFYAPLSDATIQDTWFTAGLKGTGSNTVVFKDAFLPEHRLVPPAPPGHPPGKKHVGEPSDYFALLPHLRSVMLGVLVGMAEAALELVIGGTSKRGIVYTTYSRQTESHVVQKEIGEAATMIHTARVLMDQANHLIDQAALNQRQITYLEQTRNKGETVFATDLLVKAVEKLMYVSGSSGFMESTPLQRYWRDLNVAARHAANVPHVGYEMYGRALMGVEPNIAPHPSFI